MKGIAHAQPDRLGDGAEPGRQAFFPLVKVNREVRGSQGAKAKRGVDEGRSVRPDGGAQHEQARAKQADDQAPSSPHRQGPVQPF